MSALTGAKAGDSISIKPGTYRAAATTEFTEPYLTLSVWFYSRAEGTASAPIVLQSEDPANPAILEGNAKDQGYGLWLTGSYWRVRNLIIRSAYKGVMLDNSNHSILKHLEVSDIGQEGIHLRNGSSDCVVESCYVHTTGLVDKEYGEAVYVGSDKSKWDAMKKECDRNRVTGCILGPGVTGEHVDIKEGTTATLVDDCVFHGAGISGANSADGFIDAKGNDAVIRDNEGYQEDNAIIVSAFQVHQQVSGWGTNNTFSDNIVHMSGSEPFVVQAPTGTALVARNVREPAGNMYKGKFTDMSSIKKPFADARLQASIEGGALRLRLNHAADISIQPMGMNGTAGARIFFNQLAAGSHALDIPKRASAGGAYLLTISEKEGAGSCRLLLSSSTR